MAAASAAVVDTKQSATTPTVAVVGAGAPAHGISTSAPAAAAAAAAAGDSNKPAFTSKAAVKTDLFAASSAGANYAANRPTYPPQLFDDIVAYTRAGLGLTDASKPLSLAVDVGSGTGQATVEVAQRCARVVGVEGSKAMRDGAAVRPNVTYVDGVAEHLPDAQWDRQGVQLITVAQALHWFDLPKFFAECHRVLVPGGAVALWTYGKVELNNPEAARVMDDFHHRVLGPHWDEKRGLVDNHYRDISLPSELFTDCERRTSAMGRDMTLTGFMAYVGTFSAVKTLRDRDPGGADPRLVLQQELLRAYGGTDPAAVKLHASHTVTLLLGRRRKPDTVKA